ncbi:hypothetical protein QVD17_17765 [Tagetes erecta]|uniref:Uncharacterized protein n=1 Tax=Tagetes erecta TaxID=13708 RepID=A0AAD8NUM7_TARER|nr:hypothetical protein QVD17_17765 [Tagetes erecta]
MPNRVGRWVVWFHGDAFGLKDEYIGIVIGFKCHKCRERLPPVCPQLNSIIDEPKSGKQEKDEGTDCAAADDVSSATVVLEQKPVDTLSFTLTQPHHPHPQTQSLPLSSSSSSHDRHHCFHLQSPHHHQSTTRI